MFYDPTYILVIPALIFALVAQCMVKSTFSKYSRICNRRGVTAAEVARKILDENGLFDVRIERVSGELTDHYDPRTNVVRLSDSVYNSTSVAAALRILEGSYILENDENKMAKKVLTAAAMTYVAALFSALTTLLRLVLISNNRRR